MTLEVSSKDSLGDTIYWESWMMNESYVPSGQGIKTQNISLKLQNNEEINGLRSDCPSQRSKALRKQTSNRHESRDY